MLHIKLNAEQTCRFLNCSRATLSRMINDGRVPRPYKEAGGKEYWYQDELEDYISKQ
jgi:predicted DNA-binding transcriptional regulator AlpA